MKIMRAAPLSAVPATATFVSGTEKPGSIRVMMVDGKKRLVRFFPGDAGAKKPARYMAM